MSNALFFEASGPEQAETIVFLHGGGAAGWMWRKVVNELNAEFHCLVPDLPEQGKSLKAGTYSTEYAADCVAELIREQAHGGKAHVVGLSEGAQVTVALLSRTPEVVDHAVISSAILRPLPSSWMYTRKVMELSHRWFIEPFKNVDWWIRLNMHSAAGIPDEYFEEFKGSFQDATVSSTTNMMFCGLTYRMPAGLDRVHLPVLVVVGSKEYSQMIESGRDLLRVLPNACGVKVSLGAGSSLAKEHNWAMTAPDLFSATVRAWVRDEKLPDRFAPL
jgi:pimeloyl-ACP methyl ester carboxylesterase